MLFFFVLFGLTAGIALALAYMLVGMNISERIWELDKYSDLYAFLGLVFIVFWISLPVSLAVYLRAVSSAG